ncbi:MAG: hypothetical protein AB2A00_24380 [Myxococcota bacterium]
MSQDHKGVVLLVGGDARLAGALRTTAERLSLQVRVVPAEADATLHADAGPVRLVLADGDAGAAVPALIRKAKADATLKNVPMVAFLARVEEGAFRAVREAGAERILVRDQLEMDLNFILRAVV